MTLLSGFQSHLTSRRMGDSKRWSGVFSRGDLRPLPDPHAASAAAFGMGMQCCTSILPWRSCGTTPWGGGTSAEKTIRAVDQLMNALPLDNLVWGGDWNDAMQGREYVGTMEGRAAIKAALTGRRLKLATEDSPHRISGLAAIDHTPSLTPPRSWVRNALLPRIHAAIGSQITMPT